MHQLDWAKGYPDSYKIFLGESISVSARDQHLNLFHWEWAPSNPLRAGTEPKGR
jgi:hypothetical protein